MLSLGGPPSAPTTDVMQGRDQRSDGGGAEEVTCTEISG